MKIFPPYGGFLAVLLNVFGCHKEPVLLSKTAYLTASVWKVDGMGIDQNKDGIIDPSSPNFLACYMDNTVNFQTNGAGTFDEGAIKCYPFDPQTANITWILSDAETNINISGINSPFAFLNGKTKILELSATTLVLSKDTILTLTGTVSGPVLTKFKH